MSPIRADPRVRIPMLGAWPITNFVLLPEQLVQEKAAGSKSAIDLGICWLGSSRWRAAAKVRHVCIQCSEFFNIKTYSRNREKQDNIPP
jgi:hypothetical protein